MISESVKNSLKVPLGRLYRKFPEKLSGRRIISIGDVCTLDLLWAGITPHLAVYDYRSMRRPLGRAEQNMLKSIYRNPRKYRNPAGTVSDRLLRDAGKLIHEGGAVLIAGEEDLTALAFILGAGENDLVVYGQPNEGLVVVMPDEKLKRKIEKWLASSASL